LLPFSSEYFVIPSPPSLTLREEHRLKVSKNMVLRIIFGPKREEVAVS